MAWESDHTRPRGVDPLVHLRRRTPARRRRDAPLAAGATAPSIGIDDQANCRRLVGPGERPVDRSGPGRGFNPDGTAAGRLPAQCSADVTTGRQEQPAVAVSPWGEVALTYTDDNDGNPFDQVILGLGLTNAEWVAALKRRPTTLR